MRTSARWALLLVLAGTMLIDSLEVSMMVVVLPSAGRSLNLAVTQVQALVTGFALGFAALLPLGGRAVHRFGRRRVYLGALLLFAAASMLGGLSADFPLIVATRVVKGCCAALTAPAGLTIIAAAFPPGRERDRAISVYTIVAATGFTGGLLLAGAVGAADWRWTLIAPAPAALLLFLLGLAVLPDAAAPPPVRLGAGAVAAAPGLLRAMAGAATLNGSYLGLLLLATVWLQTSAGWSPLRTAVALLPVSVPLALAAPFSGRVVSRFGVRWPILAGAVTVCLGYLVFGRVLRPGPVDASAVLLPLLLVGIGFALSFTALNVQTATAVPPEQRAAATGRYQTAVQAAAVVVPLAVAVLLSWSAPQALWLVIALGALGVAVAVTGLLRPARAAGYSLPTPIRTEHRS
ncbi:MFS transporter [Micromonospora sp. NPDC049102]|uniref:MFS transporter n=1 Tax=Micromonospora sp. NPDC049102 TaxID=3364265 RepID=UPI0037139DA5